MLLHGLLDCAVGWDGLACAMRQPCIALDLPGFGGSDLPTRPRISAYAEVVTWALGELDVSEVVLVGHSLGGAVATAVAERAPERIGSLVLLAPAGFGRVHLAEAISVPVIRNLTAAALPLALANPLVLTAAYMTTVSAGQLPEARMLQRVMRRALRATPGARDATRAVVAAGLSAHGFDRRRVAFDGPVTALWGERDRLVPLAHAAGVRRALPQATVHVWSAMGHHPQHERPGALAKLIQTAAATRAPPRESLPVRRNPDPSAGPAIVRQGPERQLPAVRGTADRLRPRRPTALQYWRAGSAATIRPPIPPLRQSRRSSEVPDGLH
ncbi:MAG TPA: alpha/beta fold hydrolase [Baekduia sp.]|nr:alpha/beta fold hydrolase [Baekduia sp.]